MSYALFVFIAIKPQKNEGKLYKKYSPKGRGCVIIEIPYHFVIQSVAKDLGNTHSLDVHEILRFALNDIAFDSRFV